MTPLGRATVAATAVTLLPLWVTPTASADNKRLNESVVQNVYTMMRKAGCRDTYGALPLARVDPKLQLAAQWHTNDVLNNRELDGDIGSDGTTVTDRARNAGYNGEVAETVAINPALSINAVEVINQWFYRPDYHAIMSSCANVDIGVWSENSLDRSVVVAVYGRGDAAPPVPGGPGQYGWR